ncbi:MAG: hypothetical protein JW849_02425 [Phycisphaerae bacterium]|nr:hypothetical protein [Phycisphaerae bacterium]
MHIISALLLIACGVLAAAGVIVKKKPEAKELIEKMTPYQGVGGVVLLIWGLISLIRLLLNAGILLDLIPGWFVTYLLVCLVSIALGFLLGFSLISKYVLSKNEQAVQKGEQLRAKLAKIQEPLGIAGIVLGLWGLVSSMIWL